MAVLNRTIQAEGLADNIRKHHYFASLSDERVAALAEEAACYAFAPGEMIFLDGEPGAGLWLLNAGQVKIFKCSPDGNEHILYVVGPGDSFNNIAALDGGPNPASACALSAVSACVLTCQTLHNTIRTDPELALIRFLADRTWMLVQQVVLSRKRKSFFTWPGKMLELRQIEIVNNGTILNRGHMLKYMQFPL